VLYCFYLRTSDAFINKIIVIVKQNANKPIRWHGTHSLSVVNKQTAPWRVAKVAMTADNNNRHWLVTVGNVNIIISAK